MKQLITTPIYYVNDAPHIGHAYTTIIADMLKKHKWLMGDAVFLLTGTDEHGQKIEQAAKAKHKSPKAYTDEISGRFRALWDLMGIDYDHFIRTTDSYHKQTIVRVFERLCANGDVYLGEYEGDYCVSCESFFLNASGVCPDCAGNKPLTKIKEESYFFALSKYEKRLLEWYASSGDVILPTYRKNEVVRFVENGLQDLSISRTSFEWGVALPAQKCAQKQHIAYVWLDALFNYMSALGLYSTESTLESSIDSSVPSQNMSYWECATHIVGKDILRFHAVYWPAFLMSLDLPLPKHIYAHGWWMRDGEKMSKSLGNVVDPGAFTKAYGAEVLRYYLLREAPFGQDGDFSQKLLCEHINGELANDLGNLLNRVLGMSEKYTNLHLEPTDAVLIAEKYSDEVAVIERIIHELEPLMDSMQIKAYIESIWKLLHLGNVSIAKYEPWNLYKQGDMHNVQALLSLLANILLKVAHALYPIMPQTATAIAKVFAQEITPHSYAHYIKQYGFFVSSITLCKIPPLFQKLDSMLIPESTPALESKTPSQAIQDPAKSATMSEQELVGIEDFSKLDIRVGEVLEAEIVPKSSKLLRLTIDIGEDEPRIVLSGIAQYYAPQDLINTQVCVITNLKPAKIMGQFSYGMILASKDEESLSLVRIEGRRKNGSRIS